MTINLSDEAVVIIHEALELLLSKEHPTQAFNLDDERTDTLLTLCNTFEMEAQEIKDLSAYDDDKAGIFSDDPNEYDDQEALTA